MNPILTNIFQMGWTHQLEYIAEDHTRHSISSLPQILMEYP